MKNIEIIINDNFIQEIDKIAQSLASVGIIIKDIIPDIGVITGATNISEIKNLNIQHIQGIDLVRFSQVSHSSNFFG